MKNFLTSSLLALTMAVSPLAAQAATGGMRIAVVDREEALLATSAAKAAQDKLNADMKPERDKLEQLRREIKAMEESYQKNAATMGEKQKAELEDKARAKTMEFTQRLQQVQQKTQTAQQELLKRLLPSMGGIIEELRKAGNYDIILERSAAIYVAPEHDLTKRVLDRLNAK
ncbi:OmpH family outer membrane protein [Amnimonas aquatica]|uniref:OmpH family outer membrane protein n=1 Tax=Amnimonas aquatica TaxID=2094561 RepID=A0A2P6AUB2_9GAMM|nr:OmpH family outer membrane protein [Amnimonas aquatica]PQA49366.1 hypothetical protein C5O18_02595 [Amnimonas aquatica]